MPRSTVTHGTERNRVATLAAGYFTANEIYATTDEKRVFLDGSLLVGPVRHADVINEAAMLALNATNSRGCFPCDFVKRTDTGTMWMCITNRGALLTDWFEFSSADLEAASISYDNSVSALLATNVQAAIDELKVAVDGGGGGGGGSGVGDKLYLFSNYH